MSLATEVGMGFAVGAFAVPSLSLSADRFGSKLAGAFGGFPATVAASLFFLGRAQGAEAASESATVIPMMEGFLGIFLAIFALLAPKGLLVSLGTAALIWTTLVAFPLFLIDVSFFVSILSLISCLIISMWLLEKWINLPSVEGKKITLAFRDIFFRMLLGGSVVGLAVYLGSSLGPIIGGIVASFPAVIVSTLYVIYKNSGPDSAAAFAKSVCLNALLNTGVFTGVVYYTFRAHGLYLGTLIGFLATGLSGMFCWYYSSRRMA